MTIDKYLSVNVVCHPLAHLKHRLKKLRVTESSELPLKAHGDRVVVAGQVVLVHTPPTKSGVRVIFVTIEDMAGLIDLVVFPNVQHRYAKLFLSGGIICVFGKLRKLGKRDVSIIVKSASRFLQNT
jgi:DNA polymerase III alpha subunit